MKKISIISLFPQALEAYLGAGMMAKAAEIGAVAFETVDLRRFGVGPRRQVDDTPYGGGGGMILRVEPLVAAVEDAKSRSPEAETILLTPRGEIFDQQIAAGLADSGRDLILVGGRYEGYDERLVGWTDRQLSIGCYVLTGCELPALVLADAVVRLLGGVLGAGEENVNDESFTAAADYLEHPQYTKPEVFRGLAVPPVLLSGNHREIADWRRRRSGSAK